MEPEADQGLQLQGLPGKSPTLVISANSVQDLQVLGPTAVSYICSKDQGLQLSQAQEQGQQEQEGGAGEPALVEEGGQPALQGQSQVLVGFQGGLRQGQSWFEAWEGESRQEGGGVVEGEEEGGPCR